MIIIVLVLHEKMMLVVRRLLVYPHRQKNMPDHGWNKTYDLYCKASSTLCQMSSAVRSVRLSDISKSSLSICSVWI